MTRIINIWGGPGVGKSTVASGLYHEMKKLDYSVEYVTEYAKDLVWEGTQSLLENQLHIFSEQYRKQFKLLGNVDYIVTDSPIALSCIYYDLYNDKSRRYNSEYSNLSKHFFLETFRQFQNLNYYLPRQTKYNPSGRVENENAAKEVDRLIHEFLEKNITDYQTLDIKNSIPFILRGIRV